MTYYNFMTRKPKTPYKKKLNKITFGLFDTLIDVCLFGLYVTLQCGKNELFDTIAKAIHLTKITHRKNFQRTIYFMKHKNYWMKKHDYLKITQLGRERLARALPKYEEKRPWDGILYLVTYDIPEQKRRHRDYLRDFLKQLKCGQLQKSVWLTPYSPRALIIDFVRERRLAGLVLVSELKEGSRIGGENLTKVLERLYKLDELNEQYSKFVCMADEKKLSGVKLLITYLSILKKDPQLPFELLGSNWMGVDAYEIYINELKKIKSRSAKVK